MIIFTVVGPLGQSKNIVFHVEKTQPATAAYGLGPRLTGTFGLQERGL
jgi:hypothetical protein